MIKTDEYNASIVDREDLHEGLFHLWVRPDAGELPPFEPGQFVSIGCIEDRGGDGRPRLVTRSYSIGSPANERHSVELFIVRVDEGHFTSWLQQQQPGSRVWLSPRAAGRLTLAEVPRDADLVLVSTGTGIAPYVSMYRTYHRDPPWRSIVIINGVREAQDLGYREELQSAAARDSRLTYLPLVSRAPEKDAWDGLRGRVQSVLDELRFRDLTGVELSPASTHVFLCGNPEMVDSVEAALQGRGFRTHSPREPGNIHVEKYW
jgi:ferredoxin--NADP+ reductase